MQDRPGTFKDVVGQPDAINKIKYILSQGWGGNVWWISGPSGTGKTTLARLIAIYRDTETLRSAEEYGVQNNWGQDPYSPWYVKEFKSEERLRTFTYGLLSPATCYVVDEAHGLPQSVVRFLNDYFERDSMSKEAVLIFTALRADIDDLKEDKKKDFQAFLSRLIHIKLTGRVRPAFIENCKKIAKAHGLDPDLKSERQWKRFAEDCHGSHREMLEKIQDGWLRPKSPS